MYYKSINCGERNIQSMYRISLKDVCDRHGIKIGDPVEVYIKKVNKNLIDVEIELDNDLLEYIENNNLNLNELVHEWIDELRLVKKGGEQP